MYTPNLNMKNVKSTINIKSKVMTQCPLTSREIREHPFTSVGAISTAVNNFSNEVLLNQVISSFLSTQNLAT